LRAFIPFEIQYTLMTGTTSEEFNARSMKCKLNPLNQVVLPKRIVDEYSIKPRDMVTLLGKRASGIGIISFNVAVHRHNNSVSIPKTVADFCSFEPGTKIKLKLIRIRHTPQEDPPAPPGESQ
jgi:hypothetical protein